MQQCYIIIILKNPKIIKIAIFEDSSKSKFGGGQNVSLHVIRALYGKKDIVLFDSNSTSIFFNDAKKYFSNYYILRSFSSKKSGYIGFFLKGIEFFSFPFYVILNCLYINSILKNSKSTLLYVTTKKLLVFAYILNIFCGYQFIYHAHLIEKNPFFRYFYLIFLRRCLKVIAVSNSVNNNIGLDNVVTISNPIDNYFLGNKKSENKSKYIVASFSTLIKQKGIDYFIKSYQYLNVTKSVEYWIFGDGPEFDKLSKMCPSNVIMKGFSTDVVSEICGQVDILCFPSIIEESFGMVILESFVCGVPVITTNIGGQSELVNDGINGYLVPTKNSFEISNKISLLINNKSLLTKLSQNALNTSRLYNLSQFELEILRILD